mmetsp:Transcript_5657/g.13711  ORF Transcript_5657/g.13711 Transcript_5657/m.13711 type:complete len:422 (+) Transcript_5657:1202-2467(+)
MAGHSGLSEFSALTLCFNQFCALASPKPARHWVSEVRQALDQVLQRSSGAPFAVHAGLMFGRSLPSKSVSNDVMHRPDRMTLSCGVSTMSVHSHSVGLTESRKDGDASVGTFRTTFADEFATSSETYRSSWEGSSPPHRRVSKAKLLAGGMEAASREPRLVLEFSRASIQTDLTDSQLSTVTSRVASRGLVRMYEAVSPFRNRAPLSCVSKDWFVVVDPLLVSLMAAQAFGVCVVLTELYAIDPLLLVISLLVPPVAEMAAPVIGLLWLVLDHFYSIKTHAVVFPLDGRVFVAVQGWSFWSTAVGFLIRAWQSESALAMCIVLIETAVLVALKLLLCCLANLHVAISELEVQRMYMQATEEQEEFVADQLARRPGDHGSQELQWSMSSPDSHRSFVGSMAGEHTMDAGGDLLWTTLVDTRR